MNEPKPDSDEIVAFEAALRSLEELNQLLSVSKEVTSTDVSKEDFERLFDRMDPFAWNGGAYDPRFIEQIMPALLTVAVTLSQSFETILQYGLSSHQYGWIIDAAYPHLNDVDKAGIISFLLSMINDPLMFELEGYGIVHAAALDSIKRQSPLFGDLERTADRSDRLYEVIANVKCEQQLQVQECRAIIQQCDNALNTRSDSTT